MKNILFPLGSLVLIGGLLFASPALSGSIDKAAQKADQGLKAAGQKVDSSTRGARDATDAVGTKTSKATQSGSDKAGGFFQKTENTVESWMKGLEKKMKD